MPEAFDDAEEANDANDDVVFEARTDDGRRLTNMLSSICLSSRQKDASSTLAWVEVSDNTMSFTVGVAKSLQAVAYVKREGIFLKWWLAEHHRGDRPTERLEFGINLVTLLECLRIFGGTSVGGNDIRGHFESKAQLHINFRASTACLNLCLVEGHSVTECELHTLDIEPPHRVQLSLGELGRFPARIVVAADVLKSAIDELEWGGDNNRDKRVTLRIGARPGTLSLTVSSTDVGCEMVFPSEALVALEAQRDVQVDYRFLHMFMALRALKDAYQVQLQLDEAGTLEIKMRFTSNVPKAAELFSHFFLFPLLDEDDIDAEGEPPTGPAAASTAFNEYDDDF